MGCSGDSEELRLGRADPAVSAQVLEPGEHHRERLVRAPLAQLQAAHRLAVRRVAGEVEAPEAFHGEDLAGAQQFGGRADGRRRVAFGAGGHLQDLSPVSEAQQPHARPADGARVGLGVEAPVERVLVLPPAGGAKREVTHGGALAVVGQVLDDREPRTAVGAVGERVAVTPVVRVEELPAAVGAGRDVRRDQLIGARVGPALEDDERLSGGGAVGLLARRRLADLVRGDVTPRRRLRGERLDERRNDRGVTLGQHLDAGGRVQHPAAYAVLHRERVDERPEPDALDHAAHAQTDGATPGRRDGRGVLGRQERHEPSIRPDNGTGSRPRSGARRTGDIAARTRSQRRPRAARRTGPVPRGPPAPAPRRTGR